MLVERGLQVMNVEVVGDAYAIASNYLRKAGAIPDSLATNERLLEIIVQMFQRGEFNRIRLANKAIAKFEAETYHRLTVPHGENIMEAAIDRIMQTYALLLNRTAAASDEAREKVTDYVKTLFEAGEKDTASAHRVRADLSAPARRQHRSGEGGLYRAVRVVGANGILSDDANKKSVVQPCRQKYFA